MTKKAISLRIDTELLDWLKKTSPDGYQVTIHNILQNYKQDQVEKEMRRIGRAQQIFEQYRAKCFWHMRRDLVVTSENMHLVCAGLRKYGGLEGLRLAAEIETK